MTSEHATLVDLLGRGEVIDQAIDVLKARDGVDRDGAFAQLVRGSGRSRRRVCELAAEIVEQNADESVEPTTTG